MIQKIKEIMNGKTITGKMDNTKMIINAIVRNEAKESEIVSFITKNNMSEQSIVESAIQESKKLNRHLLKFDTLEQYRECAKSSNLGDMWINNDNKYCAYKY